MDQQLDSLQSVMQGPCSQGEPLFGTATQTLPPTLMSWMARSRFGPTGLGMLQVATTALHSTLFIGVGSGLDMTVEIDSLVLVTLYDAPFC